MKEKILIALSDQALASSLSEKLKLEGYSTNIIVNGDEVLQDMQLSMPDLLVIDLFLSGKSGYDILAEKSLDRITTKIPVVVVSNSGSAIEMKRIPSTPSIKDYIIRSHVDPEEIIKKISNVFGHSYDPHNAGTGAPDKKFGKIILWAEDDKLLSTILVKKLQSLGHTVLKANNGDEAIKFAEEKTPDIIILDILLPGMTGFDILQRLKMNPKMAHVPAIMLSNMNRQSDIDKSKALGAQKFLVKAAVSLDEIVKEVEQSLKI